MGCKEIRAGSKRTGAPAIRNFRDIRTEITGRRTDDKAASAIGKGARARRNLS